MKILHLPSSFGDAVDKMTILEIKLQRIGDGHKQENVRRELELVSKALFDSVKRSPEFDAISDRLKVVNSRLWDVEDAIRRCEAKQEFGDAFIRLARSVYQQNDERARLKREINILVGSVIIEEKSYARYDAE